LIVGIGHDLVFIPRITEMLERWDQRFLDRIFSPGEQRYCAQFIAQVQPRHFAARFAAKEAFYKALSRGRTLGIWFRDMEVVHETGLSLRLGLSSKAQGAADTAGVEKVHLSLTHDGDYAGAFVVLEGR